MFVYPSVLLIYALLTFGAVLDRNHFALQILWIIGLCSLLVLRCVRHNTLSLSTAGAIAACAVIGLIVDATIGTSLIACAWAYIGARDSKKSLLPFFHFLMVIGIFEALLGLIQYFWAPGWIFGYVNPNARSSGTLINRNHFAGLLEMIIPVCFGLAYIAARRAGGLSRSYVYLLAGAFMGLALLFSLSRMGIFSFIVTAIFIGVVLQLRRGNGRWAASLGLTLIALVLVGALWIGIDVILDRYSEMFGDDAVLREGRLFVFRDVVRMITANPFGVGSENFQDTFRKYQVFRPDLLFDHAHNDYLETAASWGVPIACAFWTFVLFVLFRGVRYFLSASSVEARGLVLAGIGSILSILIHSLADFNLQIPSNAMLFFIFVGISLAIPTWRDSSSSYKDENDLVRRGN